MDVKFGGNYLITCTYIVFIVGMLELDMLISVGPFCVRISVTVLCSRITLLKLLRFLCHSRNHEHPKWPPSYPPQKYRLNKV